MARTKREIAAKLFEAGLFNHHIYAAFCCNPHVGEDDPRHHYIELFIAQDKKGEYAAKKTDTLFRFFITLDEWRGEFVPTNGFTAGSAMKMVEKYWDRRVCGSDPWGIKDAMKKLQPNG